MRPPRPIVAACLAAALALAATAFVAVMILDPALRRPDWRLPLETRVLLHAAYGTHAAITILAAGWVAFGQGRLSTRLVTMLAWLLLLLMLPWQAGSRSGPSQFFSVSVVSLGTWLGGLGLMAAARRFGIRVVAGSHEPLAEDRRTWQFSILGMLAIMTEVALATAILRALAPAREATWTISYDDAVWMLIRVLNNLLVASTVITCFHVPRPWWWNLVLASAFVTAITFLHVGATMQYFLYPFTTVTDGLAVWGVYYGVVLGWLLAAVALLDAAGYRLRRCYGYPAAPLAAKA